MMTFSSLYDQLTLRIKDKFPNLFFYAYTPDLNSVNTRKPCVYLGDNVFDVVPYCNVTDVKMFVNIAIADTTEKQTAQDIQRFVLSEFEKFMTHFHGMEFIVDNCKYTGRIGKNRGKNIVSIDGLYSISKIEFQYYFEVLRRQGE